MPAYLYFLLNDSSSSSLGSKIKILKVNFVPKLLWFLLFHKEPLNPVTVKNNSKFNNVGI